MRSELTEVVISNRSSLIGSTLKRSGFRALFDAAVVAIRRDGATLSGKLGEVTLQSGDFLLLATGPDFHQRNNLNKHFFIVSEQIIARKLSTKQDWLTILGFGTVIALAAFEVLSLLVGLLFLLAGLGLAGVTSHAEIKRNIPLNVMVVIVGALSLATGLENAGVFALLTQSLTPLINGHSMLVALVLVYLLTLLLTEFVTNNAMQH